MILHARWQGHHDGDRPVLVWLHGFLGSGSEWQVVQSCFPDWPQLSIDLPGHGGSCAQQVSGFDALSARLSATLRFHRVRRYCLIGYSLGGRVALFHACRYAGSELVGLIVEAGHYGLADEGEKRQRLTQDEVWASRFRRQPLRQTLEQWYRQPVFADLDEAQRQTLIALRENNYREALATMLLATSLSRQPCLLPELHRLTCPFLYLCGEQDSKFQQLAREGALPVSLLPRAGHNAHLANPQAFVQQAGQMLTHV